MKTTIKRFGVGILFAVLLLAFLPAVLPGAAAERWLGVDEAVLERIAGEHGREATGPLVDTDQGNLLLFLFLLAGATAGFIAGYFWRVLTKETFRNSS